MYLYVFVFIILAIMSIYMELFSMRVARLSEQQTTGATIMRTWHDGAYAFALSNRAGITNGTSGCAISPIGAPPCAPRLTGAYDASNQYFAPEFYDATSSYFTSYGYLNGTEYYVITYMTSSQMGFTPDQVAQQVGRLKYHRTTFGTAFGSVVNGTGACVGRGFLTPASGDIPEECYTIGVTPITGTIGFISRF